MQTLPTSASDSPVAQNLKHPKSKFRTPLLMLTVIILTALLAGGGVYYWQQQAISELQLLIAEKANTVAYNISETPKDTSTTPTAINSVDTNNWKEYENSFFALKNPSRLSSGEVAENSVLGTNADPVRGLFVGPLVFVILDSDNSKDKAKAYFKKYTEEIQRARSDCERSLDTENPCPACSYERVSPTTEALDCRGEGGPATYAYITGEQHDIFVDGYSEGYTAPTADRGQLDDSEISELLKTITLK